MDRAKKRRQRYTQLDGNIETQISNANWRHSQLQQEIMAMKRKQNTPQPKSASVYEFDEKLQDVQFNLELLNETMVS